VIIINRVQEITEAQADELYRRLPKRSKLIFALGIETGLRISDMLRIKIKDLENPLSVFVSREETVRAYKLPAWLYSALIDYANIREPDRHLFQSRRGRRKNMHRTTYHRDIKQAIAGLDFSASAHSTRKLYLACRF